MVDTPFQTALDLARKIRFKQISSVELTTLYIERLQRHAPELNALVTLTADLALAQAKQFDHDLSRGRIHSALHGVPYGIKDLFAAKGAPTTWGSPIYANRVIDRDAAVVTRLYEAGCPLLGKLAMIEFAGSVGYRFASASISGACKTPWNVNRWSGGSSSGSAAAVAAGLAGFAIGTETWGSILCPSAFCGVTGLRPTSGRVSRDGAMALSWTMDKVGPIARSVSDAEAILQTISGPEGEDSLMRPEKESQYKAPSFPRKVKGLRVGIVRPDYGKGPMVQPETDRVFQKALSVLEAAGVTLADVQLPDIPMDQAALAIVQSEGASAFENITRDSALWSKVIDPEMRAGLVSGLVLPAIDYIRALRIRDLAQKSLAAVFSDCDVLVAPSFLQVAPLVEANLDNYFVGSDGRLSGMGNMLGLPAVGIPMGFGAGHLPLGMQIVGPPLGEETIIALAEVYQGATDWHTMAPPKFAGLA
jgi:aspartyl-tRNA(Asn)/glutamyl-tRNA(Gln) amidotransferase subunit A